MQELSLMEKFADPSMFPGLSFGEKMIGSGVTAIMGMGITFIVLILLSAIIIFMEKIFMKMDKKKGKGEETMSPASGQKVQETVAEASQNELIAVVTAAINAFEGGRAFSNLVVRKINRTAGPALAWNVAGQQDAIDSRKL